MNISSLYNNDNLYVIISGLLLLYVLYYLYFIYSNINEISKFRKDINDKLNSIYFLLKKLDDIDNEIQNIGEYIKFNELSTDMDYISKDNLFELELTHSKPITCIINQTNIKNENLNYKTILILLYNMIPKNEILQKTIFNIKKYKYNEQGYKWYSDLGISIQNKDSKTTLKEILNLCEFKKFNIYIQIELKTNEKIKYIKHF